MFESAVILAGGKSLRMGFDKQELMAAGEKVLEKQINLLQTEFHEIIVVSNTSDSPEHPGYRKVPDELPGNGPLGGVHAGLKAASSEYVYVIACDMPVINLPYIRHMEEIVLQYSPDACVTKSGPWVEPMNAFYRKSMIPLIEENLGKSLKSFVRLYESCSCLFVPETEARIYSPDFDMFYNLNSVEDLHKYEARVRRT